VPSTSSSFYCIVLLTALFISSCYWQPLPVDSPLSTPWSANITTFSDALNAHIPNYEFDYRPDDDNSSKRQTVIRLMDRCWCDFSSGNFFDPFNVASWEFKSIKRLKKELFLGKERVAENESEREAKKNQAEPEEDSGRTGFGAPTPPPTPRVTATTLAREKKGTFEALRSVFWRAPSSPPKLPDPPSSAPVDTSSNDKRRSASSWEFDLEPYGFDLVLDFKWTRQPS
jgi:hypothetical protein